MAGRKRGRPPIYVTFGEPLHPEEGEKVAQFSQRIAKEVRSLYDYTTTYRDGHGRGTTRDDHA